MRSVIALTGFRGCGKNFVYENFFENFQFKEKALFPLSYKFKNFAFADILKYYCEKIYGFTYEEIEKYKRESVKFKVGKYKLSMREILVKTANSLRELTNDAIWAELAINYMEKWLLKYEKGSERIIPVITDLRFKTELEFLQSKFKPILIYIENSCDECQKSIGNKDELEIFDLKEKADLILELPCISSKKDLQEIINQTQNKIKKLI